MVTLRVASGDDFHGLIPRFRPELELYEETFRKLHRDPELSAQEKNTGRTIAAHLKTLGVTECHEEVGGFGVVGVVRNGDGPVVMLRAETDGLPIREDTQLDYASTKTSKGENGHPVPVMHACGHDMHITCLLAATELLIAAKAHWRGTLISIFQPNEEEGNGARAMIDGGLYGLVPKPDVLLGQHIIAARAGTVQIRSGVVLTANDVFDVKVIGKGGHGSAPNQANDPVLPACSIVTKLPSLIPRIAGPDGFAIVNSSFVRAGEAANVIPGHAELKVSIRTYRPEIRGGIVKAVQQLIRTECEGYGMPHSPEITRIKDVPPVVNDEIVVEKLKKEFETYFGEKLSERSPDTASDDFPLLAGPYEVPYAYWNIGGIDHHTWDEALKMGTTSEIPRPHNARYVVAIQPTLKTGVDTLSIAALTYLFRADID
ncbi:Metal-dependent amidase/aminoacylase/carboxypeptidase (amidohydrolase) [Phlyctema vagabunda]|uniref:Metal-dependent amidase/aminoacylase/carboxypeptidase (Amidohydrolase) n=1 Tax=Phlyctema vagabunda TaxID=108571 RepID=A0ABR4P2U9_9HELO